MNHRMKLYLSFQKNKLFDMTLPAKLQSYMACGASILAVASGETEKVLNQAECGFVCKQDTESLVEMIRDVILKSTELNKMRANARKYFDEHFSKEVVIQELETMMSLNKQ